MFLPRLFGVSALYGEVSRSREGSWTLRGGNWRPGEQELFISWKSHSFERTIGVIDSIAQFCLWFHCLFSSESSYLEGTFYFRLIILVRLIIVCFAFFRGKVFYATGSGRVLDKCFVVFYVFFGGSGYFL